MKEPLHFFWTALRAPTLPGLTHTRGFWLQVTGSGPFAGRPKFWSRPHRTSELGVSWTLSLAAFQAATPVVPETHSSKSSRVPFAHSFSATLITSPQ